MKILISETAKTELEKDLKQYDMTNKGLRLFITGYGWAGPSFGMALDEPKEDDHVESLEEFKVLVEKDLTDNFPELKVDFIDNAHSKGFMISTGAEGGCGGGEGGGCSGCK